ncbi:MAG: hypothetical protein A2Y78_12400 [Acidobacteria bacterium RBG_13_68_16]|jgi:uncharacterized membrane protein|nr:MAG: hypothetical protein A2Y78_12400 [Acidobacteria bacterium RBG_13_68_16]
MNAPLGLTALPNLHPAVVHFPIALLVTAAMFDLLALAVRRQRWWLDRTAVLLYFAGAAGAGATYLTGRQAEDSLINVAPSVQPLIAQHADWALRTLLLFALLALARIFLLWYSSRHQRPLATPVRLVALALGAVGVWLLVETADRGGALVYRHGVAVVSARLEAAPDSMPVERPPTVGADTTTRLRHLADGSLEWTPEPSDSAALGTILHAPEGGTPHTVRVARAEGKGLGLEVAGLGVLVLDEAFDDVQVEAELDARGFAGEVGLVHHAQDASNACLLVVSSEGRAGLRVRSQGVETELDAAPAALPGHVFTLAVSSAGGHQKGMIEGKTVVHGHREPGSPGRVGVVVNGRGTVRILALRVVPLARGQE